MPQRTHNLQERQRGTSLIEVLVVLVILVVGILTIAQLFPGGFVALRSAQNSAFADRLANGMVETLRKNNVSLADAIYMYTPGGFNPNVSPDDLSPYAPDAAYNDINKQRYISNETFTVPGSRNANGTSYPPLYVLNYGPIYLPTAGDITVNSLPWTAKTGDSRLRGDAGGLAIDNPTDELETGQAAYLVDLNAGKLAVPPAAYKDSSGMAVTQDFVLTVQPASGSPVTVTLSVPSTYNGNWFDGTGATNATFNDSGIPAGPWTSVTLHRPFRLMGMTTLPLFGTDPYEYAIYGSNSALTSTAANMGVLAFNPLASGQRGAQALQARVSYTTLNWHILHEDLDVPEDGGTLRLQLQNLKKVGDVQFDQTLFGGLISDATTGSDILLLDRDTGLITALSTNNVDNLDDNTSNGPVQVSYQSGRITLPSAAAGQHLRVFYEGVADWAVAVQKAPSVYTHSVTGGGADDYAALSVVGPTPNRYAADAAVRRVYFPRCDAGKTVEFDGVHYSTTTSGAHVLASVTLPLSDASDTVQPGLVYADLSGSVQNVSGSDTYDPMKPLTFDAVRGISARALVVWHERGNWKTRSVDTLLTPTQ